MPRHLGGNEQVHVDASVVVIINTLTVLCMTLESASHTAPEGILRRTVHFVCSAKQRQEIAYHARLRILLTQNVVIESPLVIVGHGGVCRPAKEMLGEFQHVVSAASLARIAIDKF